MNGRPGGTHDGGISRPFREIAAALTRHDTGVLSDALERVHGPGVAVGIRALSAQPRRIAGRAMTVELTAGRLEGRAVHLGARAIDAAGAGDVIVVANDGRLDAAAWGGLLSAGAAVRGIQAVVIDGACRDVEEQRDLDVEIFCKGVVPATARGRFAERSWGGPIMISGVPVDAGDWVVGDATGIVIVPAGRVEAVIAAAAHLARREAGLRQAILARQLVSEVLDASYESLIAGGE